MYVWEKCFEKSISEVRQKEMSALLKCAQIRGYVMNLMLITERSSLMITLIVYTFFGNPITASVVRDKTTPIVNIYYICIFNVRFELFQVFSLSQFFNKIQETIGFYFPSAIVLGAECLVTLERIEKFLILDEHKSINYKEKPHNSVQMTELHAYENKGTKNSIEQTLFLPLNHPNAR